MQEQLTYTQMAERCIDAYYENKLTGEADEFGRILSEYKGYFEHATPYIKKRITELYNSL